MDKSPDAFRTISEVADDLGLPQHVLRFWETRFAQIKPMKRTGGRRYYRPDDVELVRAIKHLLYGEGYTIKGVQRLFKENGARAVVAAVRGGVALASAQTALTLGEDDDDEAEDAIEPAVADEPASAPPQAIAALPQLAEIARELAECARILRAARSG
ncbi:MAG TPA: MerR family transcriptional regulator [Rhodoblastus sp.]|mgnify:CR=1 FL=1|nr:MerR family transcriptional regulator [Rhodoblastus sp.]